MRFWLLDAIETFEPYKQLTATKNVAFSEEYLQDHFPEFPVLPGVFMLEAATQAAAWLLRMSEDFKHSIITLKEAKNIKYADFVAPGNKLQVNVELVKHDERFATLKIAGGVGERPSLSGKITVERYNLADADPLQAEMDARVLKYLRKAQQAILRTTSNT